MDDPISSAPPPDYRWLWIVGGVVAVAAILCCAGFAVFGALVTTTGTSTTVAAPSPVVGLLPAPTDTPASASGGTTGSGTGGQGGVGTSRDNAAPAGSSVTGDDMTFKVTGITRPANQIVTDANMFNSEPDSGKEYVMLELEITCQAADKCHLYPSDLKLVGSEGIAREADLDVAGVDDALDSTDFFNGASLKGKVFFQMAVGETGLILMYSPLGGPDAFLHVQEQ